MTSDTGWLSDEVATFGDRLANAREQAGLSQQGLAKNIGIKVETLVAWENDLKEPRANRLQMLSGILGVSLGWLISGIGEGVPEPGEAGEISSDLTDILAEMRVLRTQMTKSVDRFGHLEKRLRAALGDGV